MSWKLRFKVACSTVFPWSKSALAQTDLVTLAYPLPMIGIRTISELHDENHALGLYCISCDRWGEADLDWLIQLGKGNKPVTEARFRCRDCGEIVEKQVRPPVPTLGGAVGYI